MSLVARAATPADLERMVPQLDQQFVFGKGRGISLTQRFPVVYCAENAGNLFVVEEHDEILSCLACKHFNLLHESRNWRGAMIGAVYTHPLRRGEGLASRLLDRSAETLRERGLDFAVLWTDQPAFYARRGWISADSGVLGEIENDTSPMEPASDVTRVPAQSIDYERIERIRQRWCDCLTSRRLDDYRQLPLAAAAVDLLAWGAGTEHAAYALVGNDRAMNILYELIGDPGGFPALWPEVCRGHRRILANDSCGSASHRWLARNTGLVWREKPLAMWLPLSAQTDMSHAARWYIPYFDRI